jgi:hypothetical protein
MTLTFQKNLTLISVIGLLYWFFGNLYEQIVISPNWVVNSPDQMKRLNEFFIVTSPTLYFVPLTQLATIMVWIVFFTNKFALTKVLYRRAALFALLATILNVIIVSTTVLKLFSPEYESYGEELHDLCVRWNILNVVRMILVGTTVYYLFNAYRVLDAMKNS